MALVALVPATFDPFGWDRFGPWKWLLSAAIVSAWAVRTAHAGTVVHRRSVTHAWLAVLLVAVVAAFFAPDPLLSFLGEGSRLYGVISLVLAFGAYLVGCSVGEGSAESVARAVVSGAGVVVAYGLVQMAGLDPLRWGSTLDLSRTTSTFGNAGFLGGYLTIVLPVAALQWASPTESRRWRQVYGATFLGGVVVLAGTKTRGSWVALLCALGLAAWLGRGFLGDDPVTGLGRRRPLLVAAACVAVGVSAVLLTPIGPRALSTFDPSSGTAAGRLDTWADTVRLVRQRPILGWGPEGFRIGFPRTVSKEWVTRYGQSQIQDRAHNVFLDTASTTGLIGLAAYGALLVALYGAGRDALAAGQREVVGIVAGLAGYMVHAQFLFDTFDSSVVFWALAGVLAAQSTPLASWRTRRPIALAGAAAVAAVALLWGVVGVVADHTVGDAIPGPPAAVVAALARAATLRPRTLEYQLLAAHVATDSNDPAVLRRAHRMLQSWGDRDVRLADAGVLTKLGAVTGERERLAEAASEYQSIVRSEPFAGLAWLGLGEAELRLGQVVESRHALEQAASLLPRSPEPDLALGFLELSAGRTEDAARHLEAAKRIAPADTRVLDLQRQLGRG